MIRTQLYLPELLYREVAFIAKREKKKKAQVIREALEKGIEQKRPRQTVGEAFLELAKLGDRLNLKGPTDLSVNHDTYYEEL